MLERGGRGPESFEKFLDQAKWQQERMGKKRDILRSDS